MSGQNSIDSTFRPKVEFTPNGVIYHLKAPSEKSSDSFPVAVIYPDHYLKKQISQSVEELVAGNKAPTNEVSQVPSSANPISSADFETAKNLEHSIKGQGNQWKAKQFERSEQVQPTPTEVSSHMNTPPGTILDYYPKVQSWPNCIPRIGSFQDLKRQKLEELKAKKAEEAKQAALTMPICPIPIVQNAPDTMHILADQETQRNIHSTPCHSRARDVPVETKIIKVQTLKVPTMSQPSASLPSRGTVLPSCTRNVEKEAKTVHECSGCLTIVPHNQLFVCIDPSCSHTLKSTVAISSPEQFFRVGTVFCGRCSFRGCHSAHEKSMREALPLAIEKSASGELKTQLEEDFKRIASLDQEDYLDYEISKMLPDGKWKVIPAFDYLCNASNVVQWKERLRTLYEVREKITKGREEAYKVVRELAEHALRCYLDLNEAVLYDLKFRKPREAEIQSTRLREHVKVLSEGDLTHQPAEVVNIPQVPYNEINYAKDQAQLMDLIDAEVTF